MEIVWTQRASDNLDYFKDQIRVSSGSEEVANKFYDKVMARADKLVKNPEWIGVPVKEYPDAGYKSLFTMDYRIIFKVSGNLVYIVSFLHKRMLVENRI